LFKEKALKNRYLILITKRNKDFLPKLQYYTKAMGSSIYHIRTKK